MDPYTGPAILSGEASGVFFHEILGHRLEGHRLKETDDSHTFQGATEREGPAGGFLGPLRSDDQNLGAFRSGRQLPV